MFSMIKTSAFVIKKYNFREYDRNYILYTKDVGKVSLLVRGARRIKSKLSPNLENFDEVRVNFIKGKIFNHLAGAGIIRRNKYILKNSEKVIFAYDCLSLLDKFVKQEDSDVETFALLGETLEYINKTSLGDFSKTQIYFFWRLIDLLGYRPQLDGCALCGYIMKEEPRAKNEELRFDVTDNIIICKNCASRGIIIKERTLNSLKKIFNVNLEEFLKIELNEELVGITNKAKQIKLSEL